MYTIIEEDCFANLSQDFLICTTVHKASHLGVFTADTYVRVALDKNHRQTKPFPSSENPHFNEYFVFEMKCTLNELLRQTIVYEVRKRTTCKNFVLGELLIDMQSVWHQPNRCFFKKWGRLECPIGSSNIRGEQGKGYLQIDLAIVSQTSNTNELLRPSETELQQDQKWVANQDYDDIQKNLLQSVTKNTINCNTRYSVIFYRGYFNKRSDYYIQFRFHPFKGKTNISKTTAQPIWNQEVNFAWTFPSLAQTFSIQLHSHEHLQWKCVAECEIHFNEIAFKDIPCLGPTYLHLYDLTNTTQYIGRILLRIQTECLSVDPKRELLIRAVGTIDERNWWQEEHFVIEFLAVQGDFIHTTGSTCKIIMKMGEHASAAQEINLKNVSAKNSASTSIKAFFPEPPYKSLIIRAILPDNRLKYGSDFFIKEMFDYMKSEIEMFKVFQLKYTNQLQMHVKCLKAIIIRTSNKLKEGVDGNRLGFASFKDNTAWDNNRHKYLQEFFRKVPENLKEMRNRLKSANSGEQRDVLEEVVRDMIFLSNELKTLLTSARLQDEWPDILLLLVNGKGVEIGVCRLKMKYFLNSLAKKEPEETTNCWTMRNFVFQNINCQHTCVNCGCIVGMVQGCLSVMPETDQSRFIKQNMHSWKQSEPFFWTPTVPFVLYKCRLFIHQAKVRPGNDRNGLCDSYVRIVFDGQSVETPIQPSTLSPIWNMVISFEEVSLPGALQWYLENPPVMAIELYDLDKYTADDYLGCGILPVSVITSDNASESIIDDIEMNGSAMLDIAKMVKTKNVLTQFQELKYLSPPPMKWIPISSKGAVRAEVLLSAELVEITETQKKSTETKPTLTFGIPKGIRPTMRNYVLEAVFVGFRNYTNHIQTGRHRIKLMMGDLMLSSGLSTTRIKNSINFLVLYASGVVSLPEQLEYWPAIIATDVLVSSRGNENTVGAVLISNSKRFLDRAVATRCTQRTESEMSGLASTSLYIDEGHSAERSPLLEKEEDPNNTFFNRFIGKFKPVEKEYGKPKVNPTLSMSRTFNQSNEFNWWTKFYNSMYEDAFDNSDLYKHKLTIYSEELEKQPEFSYLHDWAEPLSLVHGVKYKKQAVPKEEVYGTLKIHLKLTVCQCKPGDCGDGVLLRPLTGSLNPKYQENLQILSELTRIVVRVYVVQAMQLRSHDIYNQSDAFVKVQLGGKSLTNRAHFVPNQANPVFGKCFQLEGLLPREHILEISVFDRSHLRDEIIGSTFIDLEDRWRTKHRATIGLSNEFNRGGYNKWRDVQTPSDILNDLCAKRDVKPPKISENTIEVDGITFYDQTQLSIEEDQRERLSLTVLRNLDIIPSFGYKLVPEHVETRSLYRADCPGIEQGKLQLWAELYEGNLNIPPTIDITPQPPQIYELRVIIHNCADVVLDEKNVFGTKMSDIFIKGWCHDASEVQKTDTHFRSLDGSGNFNWRMIFPLKYSAIEDMMVGKRKSGLLEEYEIKQPPVLYIQVFDSDIVTRDDFLCALELNLSNFMEPYATAKACTLTTTPSRTIFNIPCCVGSTGIGANRKRINLFQTKRVRGWFPMRSPHSPSMPRDFTKPDRRHIGGKLEVELEILTDTEASTAPAGLGRNPPQALEKPVRPDVSFNPLLNPHKVFSRIVWPKLRKYFIFTIIFIIGIVVIISFATDIPKRLIGLGR